MADRVLYYLATIAGTWLAQLVVLSGDHSYWHVDGSHIVLSRDHLTGTVSLYYLATMATITWIAQGHNVLSGDHGYLPSALLVTSHKPTQRSNFVLFTAGK